MAIRLDDWDTRSNREAEGSATFTRNRTADISEAFMPGQDQAENTVEQDPVEAAADEAPENAFPLGENQLMQLVRSAFSQGKQYQEQVLQPRWLAAYNAFNNKHTSDSKYSSSRFRGRSRLFRPKTRATARKKQSEAAAALFSTQDAVIVKAADESNEQQLASAELIASLLRFRLDRASENSGIPWFMISMGAHLTALQTGVCVSKQYWEYRREPDGMEEVPVEVPLPPELQAVLGKPSISTTKLQPKFKVVRDRPRIDLMPPEDAIRDPAASWEDQAQDSAYLILRFPMTVEAARTFLKNANDKSVVKFYDIDDKDLAAAAGGSSDPNNAANIRRAREQNGTDRLTDYAVDSAYKQVWLHENFFRIEGHDYVFWTLGIDRMISDAVPVEDAYPEHKGARPIVIGVGALEPFKIDPMAPVEAWQELQREMNDLVNLRLDTLKQNIAPLAKVKRGASVDIRALQNRSPDTVVYVKDPGDVEFDRPGAVAGESYVEMEKLNADFDDQAGNFSTGSVQTNRQLGETVGGMQMMQSNANALGEFDLRVWIETWVEPVLRQVVKLEQYYESDQNVLAISARRAKLFQKFNVDQITDDMLTSQVAVSVDVGLGSSDPMQSLAKFQQASQITLGLLGQPVQMRLKQDAVIDEIYGKAGYKDASARFFNPTEEQDPRLQQAGQMIQQLQGQLQQAAQALKDKQGEQKVKLATARLNALTGLAKQEMTQTHQANMAFQQTAAQAVQADADRQFQADQTAQGQQFEAGQTQQAQDFQSQQADTAHQNAMQMQQAKAPPPGAYPGPGEMESPAEDQGEGGQAGELAEQPQSIHQMLGLQAPPDPAQAMAPLVQAMMMGFKMLAQQNQQIVQQLAAGEQQTVQAVLNSSEASDRRMMMITQQLAAMMEQLVASNQQGHERTAQILAAPKMLVRNPQTGQPEGVVPDLSNVQR